MESPETFGQEELRKTRANTNTQQFKNMNSLNGGKKETHITETIKY